MVKHFENGMVAERYARARPNIHPTAIERFRQISQLRKQFPLALDVGCGTGQSTVALAGIAEKIVGIDRSFEMLKHALPHPNVAYVQATAECTPFRDSQFDLVSAAQAFHWFDPEAFLTESFRLLAMLGWLMVYTSWFTSHMKDEPDFSTWFNDEYLSRYPSPPRNRVPITEGLAHKHGLVFRAEDEFTNELSMTIDRFTDYQLSTTNIIAAVRQGETSFDAASQWIRASLESFFSNKREKLFLFHGKLWLLEKA